MLLAVRAVFSVLYLVALIGLFCYGVNAFVMVALHWWHRRRVQAQKPPEPPAVWPMVTVQLPLYNERYVARRLLEAVGALDYPVERLEIQVLDDSTDDTTALLAEPIRRLRAQGLQVAHLHREARTGFKAGALAAGLHQARGEFIALFDADFVPPPDFLRQTIPSFVAPRVAAVQTRWGHLNRNYSFLTLVQALGLDGHFAVEQPARCWGGLFLHFNGTAGVWRAAAIHDAGGWACDTLTEDLDLSYRAQLCGWHILYRPELVCPAELPVLITGFKAQQCRWAKGCIQTAIKLLPAVVGAPLPVWIKYQACVHLTSYLISPLMLIVVLLAGPLASLQGINPLTAVLGGMGAVFGLSAFGPASMLVYAQCVLDAQGWRRAPWLGALMIIGVGLSWSISSAVVSALWTDKRAFARTPKFGIGPEGGTWQEKTYVDRRPMAGAAEIGLGLYSAGMAWLVWDQGANGLLPWLLLYTMGFFTVGAMAFLHTTGRGRRFGHRH
jgi:cellulose synthase/poly-beta-1,6-N-acetylglucosamine synthase-like glycosyltransferase